MLRIDLNSNLVSDWLTDKTELDYRSKNKNSSQRLSKEVLSFEIKLENDSSINSREPAQFEIPDDEFTKYFRASKQPEPEQNQPKLRNTNNKVTSFKKVNTISHTEDNKRLLQKTSPRKFTVYKK